MTLQSDLPALALAAGSQFSCGIFAGEAPSTTTPSNVGVVKCWGNNSSGQLGGVGGVLQSAPPLTAQYGAQLAGGVIVATGTLYASAIVAGGDHGCAIADDRRVHCWGSNEFLQVGFALADMGRSGLTSFGVRSAPTGLESTEVVSLAAGGDHSCTITRVATVKCWGRNDSGQLGRPAGDPQTPGDVQGLPVL
jgi:alpha-tubulin suppressor-like RCC1 family protein